MYYNVVVVALVGSAVSHSIFLSIYIPMYNSRVQSGFCPAHLDRLQGKTCFRFITNRCHYNIIIYSRPSANGHRTYYVYIYIHYIEIDGQRFICIYTVFIYMYKKQINKYIMYGRGAGKQKKSAGYNSDIQNVFYTSCVLRL